MLFSGGEKLEQSNSSEFSGSFAVAVDDAVQVGYCAVLFGADEGCQVCGCQAHTVGAERLCFCDSCWGTWWLCCNKEEIVDSTLEESLQVGNDPAPAFAGVDQWGAASADVETALACPPPKRRREQAWKS